MDIGLLTLGFPIGIALFFVVFFYGIGALYNDRSDRSALFWKSLPISDSSTVLSKVAAATVLAPVLATFAVIALQLGFLVLMSLYALLHGINPFPLLWSPTHLVALWVKLFLMLPVNALWALPTIGWLLLCSSFARSKPFLWAVMLPIFAGVANSWIGLMNHLSLSNTWFWRHIVGRLLLSIFPGSWLDAEKLREGLEETGGMHVGVHGISPSLTFEAIGEALGSPDMLIGIVAGLAMIAGAVYFRRQRTESYA
jgi:ABC-2 type transport system permease protein